ncbi:MULTISPECIES: benzoate-CoA ligase family protein [Paenibacillus]|uniref:benzoate-CoA ligase family protein n=1 Tax=Paenibacillus TaxID=44249 RepID=UPI001141CFEB|nr:benzoate-CoA ligase family protein [Paenibacillus sp. tmac-D7]
MDTLKGMGLPYNAASRFIDRNVENGLGHKVAIYFQDISITYDELQQAVHRFGNALLRLGITMEDRVLLLCDDAPEFVESFFGAVKVGAVPIPVNTAMAPADYEYFLNNSRAKVIVAHQSLWYRIRDIRDRLRYVKHVIVIHESANHEADVMDYRQLTNGESTNLEGAHTTHSDSAFWLYSSGSTGNPKGIIHLQHDMEYAFNAYARNVLQLNESDITFSASKLYFAYGLGNGMYFPFGAGASTVLLKGRPKPDVVLETIEKYRPTVFFGVPTLYGSMIDLTERSQRKYDLSSVRICISAGEALPAQFMKKWKQLYGLDILDGIGSSEVLHIFLSNGIGDIRPGSTGKIVPGYDAKVVNELGMPASAMEVGDLLVKGDSIAHGYWNLHEENKRKFIGEWLHTGDKYYMDEDGYFWYCGRSDDMIKVNGIWVSPVEIENALIKHETVFEVAVVGVKLEDDLTVSKAYVVLKEGIVAHESLKSELQAFVKNELASYKSPKLIEFVNELPKTQSGKIQRFKLRTGS